MTAKTRSALCAAVFGLALMASRAEAAIITFTDRATWDSAVGAPSFTVDFSGFSTDKSFALSPLDLGPFTLLGAPVNHPASPYGDLTGIVNIVDAAAANANLGINDFVGLFDHVDLTFGVPVKAWGGTISNPAGDEVLAIDLLNGMSVLATLLPVDEPWNPHATTPYFGFFGFKATAGEQITSLRFRAVPGGSGAFGDAFRLDDVVGVSDVSAVPEPGTLWLLLSGVVGISRAARRSRCKG